MPERPDHDTPDPAPDRDARTGRSAAAARMAHQQSWVEEQIRVAMANGEFDDLPGAGKPIASLGSTHDPDWWVKQLVEREQIALLPPSLQLRKDDAGLDDELDRLFSEAEVRRTVEDFNARVLHARYSPQDGQPPLVTMPRGVDDSVTAWRQRRRERKPVVDRESPPIGRRRWWRRSPR